MPITDAQESHSDLARHWRLASRQATGTGSGSGGTMIATTATTNCRRVGPFSMAGAGVIEGSLMVFRLTGWVLRQHQRP